jgi:hypothetical protein
MCSTALNRLAHLVKGMSNWFYSTERDVHAWIFAHIAMAEEYQR